MSLSDSEIAEEMESWRRFSEALRAEDRDLFEEMLRVCRQYAPAMAARDSPSPSEPLFMSLLLMQHKTIAYLTAEVQKLKAEKDAGLDP